MTLASADAFSGLGGFVEGFHRAGITTTVMIENNPHCRKVLAHHWPDVTLKGDIADVAATDLGRPSILAGGFPCQDTSIAAPHRAGLEGKRSGNFWNFHRVLWDFLRLVDSTLPRWVVIENPVGLLASPGRSAVDATDRTGWDMASVVRALEDLGYGWAYRVVDGRDFGSPQRRERVILVGHLGGDPRPAGQVLGVTGSGGEAARPRPVSGRPLGPTAVPGPVGSNEDTLIWRKSARPRASIANGGYETWVTDKHSNTLTGFDAGLATRQTHLLTQGDRIRTLTLTEWERLQCLPDGHTNIGISDNERFKMLGNAMHVGMAQWLGEGIVAVDAALPSLHLKETA